MKELFLGAVFSLLYLLPFPDIVWQGYLVYLVYYVFFTEQAS